MRTVTPCLMVIASADPMCHGSLLIAVARVVCCVGAVMRDSGGAPLDHTRRASRG